MIFPNHIREFRKARGWSLQRLADAVGTTKSQIDKLEKGYRRLTVDWMVRLAKPLKCDPRDLMITPPGPRAFDPVNFGGEDVEAGLIPVRDAKGRTVGKVPRPYFLSHAREPYALKMEGEAMAPMFRPGQLLFVNPSKALTVGVGVVVTDKKGALLVREFLKQKPRGILARVYQPRPRDAMIMQSGIASVHPIAGTAEG